MRIVEFDAKSKASLFQFTCQYKLTRKTLLIRNSFLISTHVVAPMERLAICAAL